MYAATLIVEKRTILEGWVWGMTNAQAKQIACRQGGLWQTSEGARAPLTSDGWWDVRDHSQLVARACIRPRELVSLVFIAHEQLTNPREFRGIRPPWLQHPGTSGQLPRRRPKTAAPSSPVCSETARGAERSSGQRNTRGGSVGRADSEM